jgi:hypothetical protein
MAKINSSTLEILDYKVANKLDSGKTYDSAQIEQYPNLYYIVHKKDDIIANVLSIVPLNISFRRSLVDTNLQSWHNLVMRIAQVHLNDQPDIFRWLLKLDGQFSVSSMYTALLDNTYSAT